MPILYIIAGPNGVGKTTFADRYLPDEAKQLEFVNVDLIARGLSPYDPDSVAIEAGKIALRRIRELIEQRAGFTWETTLSGKTAVTWLRQARQVGYELKAYFLWVRDLEIAMQRVRQRVTEGGHNIREEVSRRRFMKAIQNFFDVYRPLLHSWKLLENDASGPRLLAVEKSGRLVVRDRLRFESICRAADLHL
ncbi:MAG TPA: AAA family ATPase [Verrucomicrobiae bacterium]|nr:AAA family ATPase [Verrucomicrobiae bacterium]